MNTQHTQQALNELFTLRDILRWGASCFNEAKLFYGHGTDNAWDEALVLALAALHLNLEFGEKILDARLTHSEKNKIITLYQERIIKRLPAPYLTNQSYFAGLTFYVDERVLIPRSPIAELIANQFEPWIDANNINKIVDIGTGSACIAIAAAFAFPESKVIGVDNSLTALDVAKINVAKYHLEKRVQLVESDLFAAIPQEKFDVIIANPPYVDAKDMASLPPEYLHEPAAALAAGTDGLDIARTILKQAPNHLTPQGILVLEVGNSKEALINAFPNLPFIWVDFDRGGDGVCVLTQAALLKN